MGQTFSMQIRSPGNGAGTKGPDFRVSRDQVVEISVPAATGVIQVGLDNLEAAIRGPWVAYFAGANAAQLLRQINVENLNQIWVWFTNAADWLLIVVRDRGTALPAGSVSEGKSGGGGNPVGGGPGGGYSG